MPNDDGIWKDYHNADMTEVIGSVLQLSPVFYGEVSRARTWWHCSLNGEDMGKCRDMGEAKRRIDWEVWNRLRQIRESYRVLMSRRHEWDGMTGQHAPLPSQR